MIDIDDSETNFEYLLSKLGLCGCGSPSDILVFVHDFLDIFLRDCDSQLSLDERCEHTRIKFKECEDLVSEKRHIIVEFILHALNDKNIMGHVGSIWEGWVCDNVFLQKIKDEVCK